MNLIPNIDVAVDINSLAPVFIDHILNVNDTNSRAFSITLYANNKKISLYSGNFTAKAAISVNNILLDDNVTALIQTDSTVAVTVDNKYLTLIPGVMKIQLTITGGTDVIVTPLPILARVTSDLAQTAQILPDSHSSYSEIVAEIVAARGDFDNLSEAIASKVTFVETNNPNTATENGKVYYTTTDKSLIIPVSAEFSQVQFRLARDGKIYSRRRSRSSTSVDFPAWGTFEQVEWKQSEIESMIDNAAAYRTVTNLDDCTNPAYLYEVTGRSLAIPVQPPYKVLCVKNEDYITQMIITTNSKVYLRMGTIDINDNITFSAPDELCSRSYVDDVISSLEDQYIFVDEIPSNADHSKKYVLPDGYIWEWREGSAGSIYNANTGIINKRPPTNDNYGAALLNQSGTLVSELIPFDASWKYSSDGSYGHLADIQISGINKLVPAYNSSVIIYYYRRDNGNSLGAVLSAQMHTLNNTPNTDDITLPVQFSLMDQDIYFSGIDTSNPGATIGYVRVMIGISKTGDITENDVKDVVINVPFYDVPATSGGWVNTGVKHPDYDHGLPDGGTAGQVLTKTADGEAWQDINFSSALNVQSGQILYAVGDSITYGHGIGGNEYSWVKHVIDHNGYAPYGANGSKNLGLSGLGFCTNAPGDPPRNLEGIIGAEGFFSGADIVTVALGINDWKNSNATFSAFWSGMEYCFNKIRTDNPYCRIYYILPFNACYMGNQASYYCLGSTGDSGAELYSHTLQDFIEMIKAKFEEPTFKAFNVNIIDLTECPELNRRNITTALFDNLHPTAETNVKLGQDIARRIILS